MLNDVSCAQCGLSDLCIPHSLTDEEIIELDETVVRKKPMGRGATLYRQGDRFSSLYVVRSGAVKVYSTDQEGNEQVLAFYLPGEVLGMEIRPANSQAVRAMVPLAEMFGYATQLRSATKGRGVFTMEFDHYAKVSEKLAERIIRGEL